MLGGQQGQVCESTPTPTPTPHTHTHKRWVTHGNTPDDGAWGIFSQKGAEPKGMSPSPIFCACPAPVGGGGSLPPPYPQPPTTLPLPSPFWITTIKVINRHCGLIAQVFVWMVRVDLEVIPQLNAEPVAFSGVDHRGTRASEFITIPPTNRPGVNSANSIYVILLPGAAEMAGGRDWQTARQGASGPWRAERSPWGERSAWGS